MPNFPRCGDHQCSTMCLAGKEFMGTCVLQLARPSVIPRGLNGTPMRLSGVPPLALSMKWLHGVHSDQGGRAFAREACKRIIFWDARVVFGLQKENGLGCDVFHRECSTTEPIRARSKWGCTHAHIQSRTHKRTDARACARTRAYAPTHRNTNIVG